MKATEQDVHMELYAFQHFFDMKCTTLDLQYMYLYFNVHIKKALCQGTEKKGRSGTLY